MGRIHLKWVDNGFKRYDGRIEDVPWECIVDEDRAVTIEVGRNVQARFGQRVWMGVVVETLERPSFVDMALHMC